MRTPEPKPKTCFWELTRRCPLRCLHCRSVVEKPDKLELGLAEALGVADQLVRLGVGRVVLTGGEPIVFEGWDEIARRLTSGGVRVRLFTSGYGFGESHLRRALDAGVDQFAVSLDGPDRVHDRIRPRPGKREASSYTSAVNAVQLIRESGAGLRIVTQVNAINVDALEDTYRLVAELGATRWQVHLCQMNGRAKDHRADLHLPPADLEKIVRVLLLAAREKRVTAPMHCTLGYMTFEEPILRHREQNGPPVWRGCDAGLLTLGLTARGEVKGCIALPDEFITGSVRTRRLDEMWADPPSFPYTRAWSEDHLRDRCATCAFGRTCRAGCPAVAYTTTGAIGANPYCLKIIRGA